MPTVKLGGRILCAVLVALLMSLTVGAQGIDGVLRGEVRDKATGAPVPGVQITARNAETAVSQTVIANTSGVYSFNHLPGGTYSLNAELKGYVKALRSRIQVQTNQIVELNVVLEPGEVTAVSSSEENTGLTEPSTWQLSHWITGAPVSDLPNFGKQGERSPYALSLLIPGATTQGAGLLGEGGAIGGNRPRQNSFTIDGVDNNRLDTTGSALPVISEAVQEFNLLTNQFSAEYGHSTAGQFNVITKTGTNQMHGNLFGFGSTRKLNAFGSREKADLGSGVSNDKDRYDYLRSGATLGGPIFKGRLFGFLAYQYQSLGLAETSTKAQTITNEGLEAINDVRGLNSNNLSLINNKSIWPTALRPNGNFATVTGSNNVVHRVELGDIFGSAKNYLDQRDWQSNVDFNGDNQQIHARFLYSNNRQPNANQTFPLNLTSGEDTLNQTLFSVSQTQPIKPHLVRETRLQFRRLDRDSKVANTAATQPNLGISSLGLFLGPNSDAPQSRVENVYQFINNLSWTHGRHQVKFGAEYRRWVAPATYLPNSRGSYDWKSLESFLKDEIPTGIYGASRGVGTETFTDQRNGFYGFVQDDFKVMPRLTLNLGLRYEFMSNPSDSELQVKNEVASFPGILDFRTPESDQNNWGPRLGFAYDLFGTGKTIVRGGAGVNYDTVFGNLTSMLLPPQYQQVMTPSLSCLQDSVPNYCRNNSPVGPPNARGFLTSGGLPSSAIPPDTVRESRAATTGYIADTTSPETYTWSLGVQQEYRNNWLFEARYVGTRGLRLPVQVNRNPGNELSDERLPTYFNTSEVPANALGSRSLADLLNYPGSGKRVLEGLGFTSDIRSFEFAGNSLYHGGSLSVQRRATKGLFFRGSYTWGHVMDDASTDLGSGGLYPARAETESNRANEWANSALNRTHHLAVAWAYELPTYKTSNSYLSGLLTGWQLNGIWLMESGQPVTPLSGTDVNYNLDAGSDRVAVNPNGDASVGSGVNYVVHDPVTGATSVAAVEPVDKSRIVAYITTNPNAKWVATGLGGQSNSGRNVITAPGLTNVNLGIFRKIAMGENRQLQFRVDLFNAFNHRQYSLNGDLRNGGSTIFSQTGSSTAYTAYVNAASASFLSPSVFSGSGRVIQVGVKFVF